MKFKRSERLVFMTQHLTTHPNQLIPLTYFVDKFTQAKSSISEDIRILKDVFENEGIGFHGHSGVRSRGGTCTCPTSWDNKVTEGSTVSVNYVSGSTRKIETMVLSKRTLKEGSKVLVVDDFLRAGGSITGVINLMEEFSAGVVGVSVLVEAKQVENRRFTD